MSYIDDFINMVNDIECQKAVEHFNANQPIEKGWVTTEDGKHLFIGADGALHGGKSAYEAHQSESGSGSSSSDKDSAGDEKPKTTEMYEGPAKSFTDVADAKAYFGDAWTTSLTPNEKDAVTAYTGSWYAGLNKRLRAEKDLLDDSEAARVKALDSAIAKSELKEAIAVRRFSGPELFGKSYDEDISFSELESLVGATITDKGYTSTTVLPKEDSSFGDIAMHITVPPGKGRGAYVAPISKYKDEQEFLLARGSNFKVTGIKEDEYGNPIVEMTIVD